MKKLLSFILAALIVASAVICANADILSPGLTILSESDPMVMSGLSDTPMGFTPEDFCRHSGIDSFKRLTITSLPDKELGTLTLAGEPVSKNDTIDFDRIHRLVFTPEEGVREASFSFTVGDGCSTTCNLILTDKLNLAPTASSALTAIETFSGVTLTGNMVASDPEGDALTFEVTEMPTLGNMSYDKKSGGFNYYSAQTGSDSFTFCVKDCFGNYSDEAKVELQVTHNNTGISFSDMDGNGAYTAAAKLIESGVMSAKEQDGKVLFQPKESVSRLDFLVAAMNILGADNLPSVASSGFADDADIPDNAKSYAYSAYKLGIVNGRKAADGSVYFDPHSPITRTEAAVILNNVIGYEAKEDYSFGESIPTWAEGSVDAMYELGVLSGEKVTAQLTKADCASLLAKLASLLG